MSFIVESNNKPRPLPPFGTQLARLVQIIDLGTQKEEGTDQKTGVKVIRDRRKARLVWELPTKKAVFREGGEAEPFTVGRNFTLSLDKKASLSPAVEVIIGRPLSDAERKSFDISKLLGEASLLAIAPHQKQDGGASFKVGATSPLMDGQEVPPAYNKLVVYQAKEGANDTYQSFPDWLKQEIAESPEFKRAQG